MKQTGLGVSDGERSSRRSGEEMVGPIITECYYFGRRLQKVKGGERNNMLQFFRNASHFCSRMVSKWRYQTLLTKASVKNGHPKDAPLGAEHRSCKSP